MIKDAYKVIAVMSGTSLDGIDLIYSHYKKADQWHYKIVNATTVPYAENWRKLLMDLSEQSLESLRTIDVDYCLHLADTIKAFIDSNAIKDIDFIASHGHTALHQPDKKLTYQIGNQKILAESLKRKVICDFRVQDVALGGQGAPLVPIGDKLLFSDFDFCLNLGGFANISFDQKHERIAFDICPVNIVLNHYVSQLNVEYDDKGKIAFGGTVNLKLLDELNHLEFYTLKAPKSLGIEWVEKHVFPLINRYGLDVPDILRTVVEHMALQISRHLNRVNKRVLVTGGGAYNDFLIQRLRYLSTSEIIIPDENIIEYKEALIFGLLGILKDRKEVNCLKSVTGAKKDHSSGQVLNP